MSDQQGIVAPRCRRRPVFYTTIASMVRAWHSSRQVFCVISTIYSARVGWTVSLGDLIINQLAPVLERATPPIHQSSLY